MNILQRIPGVRPPAVAGMFYPGDRAALDREVSEFLEQAGDAVVAPGFPKALIVPHAGYIYSGAVAACAYDRLRPARGIVRRVVLLGPCHRVPVRGLALPGMQAFETPLGRIPIDEEAVAALSGLAQVVVSAATHAEEHALEVQLPFLQKVLGEFKLVPLVVGAATPEQVSEVLERLWGGAETLIVISTDLSHYHSYDEARAIDSATVRAILGFDTGISHEQACGATPLAGMLVAARRHGLAPALLDSRNSGDTAGGRGRVVGYASFALQGGNGPYGEAHGKMLLRLAREAIGADLWSNPAPTIPDESWLREIRATFVTLMLDGRLRGCVGSLEAQRPLGTDIVSSAKSAAFADSRFSPLTRTEFARLDVEVSLLSGAKRILFEDHADLLRQIEPGEDGLILECDGKNATFLPQVWEGLPDPEQFLAQLKRKAGLDPATRTSRCKVCRYRVAKWREADFRENA